MKIIPQEFKLPEGITLTVRSVSAADAEGNRKFKTITYRETHFLALYPEENHYEIESIRNCLTAYEESSTDFEVGVFDGNEQVGEVSVCCIENVMKSRHRAVMGISIEQKYWGCGLGRFLMQLAVEQTRANGFEQLELGVYSDNVRAIRLYEKFGFERCGAQPHAFKLKDGTYCDEIMMVKML